MDSQNKRKRNGAFRSCLIPFKEQIFAWWFAEKKTAREIQELLSNNFQVDVHYSTITRFIKIRTKKSDPHDRPEHLITPSSNTKTELLKAQLTLPLSCPQNNIPPDEDDDNSELTLNDLENIENIGMERYLKKLMNTKNSTMRRLMREKLEREKKEKGKIIHQGVVCGGVLNTTTNKS